MNLADMGNPEVVFSQKFCLVLRAVRTSAGQTVLTEETVSDLLSEVSDAVVTVQLAPAQTPGPGEGLADVAGKLPLVLRGVFPGDLITVFCLQFLRLM